MNRTTNSQVFKVGKDTGKLWELCGQKGFRGRANMATDIDHYAWNNVMAHPEINGRKYVNNHKS